MPSAINHQLATTRTADPRRQAAHDAPARASAPVPPSTPQPGRDRLAARLRRIGRQRRFGERLWTLLHAQALLDGSAAHPHRR
jgi:hypothetical protein